MVCVVTLRALSEREVLFCQRSGGAAVRATARSKRRCCCATFAPAALAPVESAPSAATTTPMQARMVRTPAGGAAGGKSVGKQQAAGKSAIAKPVHGGKASPAKTALPLGATIAPPHVAAVLRDGIAVAMNEGKPDVIRSVMADVHKMLSRLPGGERVAALALILHEMALSVGVDSTLRWSFLSRLRCAFAMLLIDGLSGYCLAVGWR